MSTPGPHLLTPFKLERFFAKWEFSAPHLLCCSDCQPLHMADLLQLADEDSQTKWQQLRLGYTETRGLPELRAEVGVMYQSLSAEQIVVAAPEECIYLTMLALLKAGDELVVTYPGYQSLYGIAEAMGCRVVRWEASFTDQGAVRFDVAALKALVSTTTKMVVINFPHNPSGAVLSRAELAEVVEVCRGPGAYLFSDEMYRLLELDPHAHRLPPACDVYDKAISLGGMSKAFGLPGLRIGWLATHCSALLDRVCELKDYTTICNNAPSEVLSLMALRAQEHIIATNLDIIKAGIQAVDALVSEFGHMFQWVPPAAGSVAFVRLTTGEDVEAWCSRVVEGCGVLLLPATVYDHAPSAARGYFRVGLGRRNVADCVAVLRTFLLQQAAHS